MNVGLVQVFHISEGITSVILKYTQFQLVFQSLLKNQPLCDWVARETLLEYTDS